MRLILASLLLLGFAVAGVRADGGHARADVIADATAVEAGKMVQVAIRLKIDEGWHVYWLNPGDSGEPPSVRWMLPLKSKASELEFPVPHRSVDPFGSVVFGYDSELVLLATVHVPSDASGEYKIAAEVSWLVCKDVCLPEKQVVELTLPVGKAEADHAKEFAQYRAALPKKEGNVEGFALVWTDDKHGYLKVPSAAGQDADIFPLPLDFAVFEKQQTVGKGANEEVRLPFRILKAALPDAQEHGAIVAFKDKAGNRSGTWVKFHFSKSSGS